MRRYYASSVMRLLARLLMELRKLQVDEDGKENLCFYDALTTSQYTNFVDAVFEDAVFEVCVLKLEER
jgi:hypothetical protein